MSFDLITLSFFLLFLGFLLVCIIRMFFCLLRLGDERRQMIVGKACTFSAFVVAAVRAAVEEVEEEQNKSSR